MLDSTSSIREQEPEEQDCPVLEQLRGTPENLHRTPRAPKSPQGPSKTLKTPKGPQAPEDLQDSQNPQDPIRAQASPGLRLFLRHVSSCSQGLRGSDWGLLSGP